MAYASRFLISLAVVATLLAAAPSRGFPQQPQAQLAAAVADYARGDLAGAGAALTPIADGPGPTGGRASYLLGIIELGTGRNADAGASFARAAGGLPVLADYARYHQALAAFAAGQYVSAAEGFRGGIAGDPGSPLRGLALFWRAESLRRGGDAQAADAYHAYLEAFGEGQHAADAWYEMGVALEQQGRWADAAQAYRRVLWVFEDTDAAPAAYLRLRALAAAHPLPADATPPQAIYQRATNDVAAGRVDAARAEFWHALTMKGGWIVADGAFYELGVLAYQSRRLDEASAFFRQDVALRQAHADDSLYYLVRLALDRGRDSEALAAARTLAQAYPHSSLAPRGLYAIASVREDQGALGPASALFREAANRFPGTRWGDQSLWELGWVQFRFRVFPSASVAWLRLSSTAGDGEMASAGLYWAARAAAAVGDHAHAVSEFRAAAARYPDAYYGQLAAAQSGVPVRVAVAPPLADLPAGEIPSLDRFRELDALAQNDDATRELVAALAAAPPRDQAAVALLLSQRDEQQTELRQGILEAERARALDGNGAPPGLPLAVWEALYPRGQWETVARVAGRTGVDPYLMAGVIREESRFDPGAVSSAGAYGLMQLMPGTAQGAARNAGVAPPDLRALTDPQTNVLLGAVVLSELLKQFGRVDFAVAAYNAGPEAVRRWQFQRPGLDPASFVETIPYPETRGYVKAVLESTALYHWLYRDGHP